MKYRNGKTVKVGDKVKLWNNCYGAVVCSIDTNEYTNEYQEKDWKYLDEGILVFTNQAGLIHYPEMEENIELIDRQLSERRVGRSFAKLREPKVGNVVAHHKLPDSGLT